MQLALIEAGAMGSAIGARLLDCGHDLQVFDPDATAAARLEALGATSHANAAQASRGVQIVILSLNHEKIVTQAVFGAAGVAEGMVVVKVPRGFWWSICLQLILRVRLNSRRLRRSSVLGGLIARYPEASQGLHRGRWGGAGH